MTNIVEFPTDNVEMSDNYLFAGFSEDGRLIIRLPEDHADACQLFVILQKHLMECTGEE